MAAMWSRKRAALRALAKDPLRSLTQRRFAHINQGLPEDMKNPCIVVNPRGDIDWESYDSREFLAGNWRRTEDMPVYSKERSVYTVTRTVDKFRIFQLEAHFKRLAFSSYKLIKSLNIEVPWADHEELRLFSMGRIRPALTHFFQKTGAFEARITFMLTLPEKDSKKMPFPQIHIEGLPEPPKNVHAFVRQGTRKYGEAKPLAWKEDVAEQGLLDDLPEDVNEVIMVDKDYRVTEGVSSNFAVFEAGRFMTAPVSAGILPGTIRSVLMEAYKGQIVEEQPDINKIQEWAGAFLLSTSRLCSPIQKLTLDFPPTERKTIEFPTDEEDVQMVSESVTSLIREHSELISGYIEFQQDNPDQQHEQFNIFKQKVIAGERY